MNKFMQNKIKTKNQFLGFLVMSMIKKRGNR